MKPQKLESKSQSKAKTKPKSKLMKYGFGLGVVALCWGGLTARYSAPQGFYNPEVKTTLATGDSLNIYQFGDEQAVLAQRGITSKKDMLFIDANKEYLSINNILSFIKENPGYPQEDYASLYTYVENKDAELKYSFYKTDINVESLKEIQNFTDSIAKNKNLVPVYNIIAPIQKSSYGWEDQIIYAKFQLPTDLKHNSALLIYAGTLKNQTMPETQFVIAHEMSHLITIQSMIKAHKHYTKPTRSQQIANEQDADLNALEITHDPDAAIRSLGKLNLASEKTNTLLGWFIKDIRNTFGSDSSAHPLSLDRARAAWNWKIQHVKNN